MTVISIIGTVLTAISLGLAIWTLVQARSVQEELERQRNRFLFRNRAPDFIQGLEGSARLVNLQIKEDPPNFQEMRAELERCRARLENFEPKLETERGLLRRSKELRAEIKNALQGSAVNKERMQKIYSGLHGLSEATQQLLEDRIREA